MTIEQFKIRGDQKAAELARDIAHVLRLKEKLDLVCIGAGALNVAVKSLIIARGELAPGGSDLWFCPSFNLIHEAMCTGLGEKAVTRLILRAELRSD